MKFKSLFFGFISVFLVFGVASLSAKIITSLNVSEDNKEIEVNFKKYEKLATIAGGQDGEIHNDLIFSFGSYGTCTVQSLEDFSSVSSFTLDKSDISAPHSNSVCFGKMKYDSKDEFPLLYSNIYNNDSSKKGTTNVYRIERDENNNFTSKLVQVIRIGFTSEANLWGSGVRPYGNAVVDFDNNDYWAFTMDDLTNSTKFFKFDLPKLTDGDYDETYECNVVTLNIEDVKTSFSTEYFHYLQGACYFDGKIYSSEGFTNDTTNVPTLRVIDLKAKKLTKTIDLVKEFGLSVEPEFMDFYDNCLYYKDVSGNLYKFNTY